MEVDQNEVLEQLCKPSAYPHATARIRRIETHISWVYLTGEFAYKVKKAVKLPYLDFSTLEYRERACRDELSLNQRLAPALYHAVVGIGGDLKSVRVGGTPPFEYAVKMTQFPAGSVADELVQRGELAAADFSSFAEQIAAFHQSLAPSFTGSPGDRILNNLAELESSAAVRTQRQLVPIAEWIRSSIDRLDNRLTGRKAAGHIRECHGDLHLGNIVRIDGRLIAFDCLEFSIGLRTIDVIDEVSFLFMDLIAYGRPDLAFAYLNRYLAITGDYEAVRLLRLYATHRALVRAKVESATESGRYVDTASALIETTRPLCLITYGLSGTGKTTMARSLAPKLEAVHLRSDVERKRLNELRPTERANTGIDKGVYSHQSSVTTYRHLCAMAEAALDAGINVIIDASFVDRRERDRIHSLATKLDAAFVILKLQAPSEVLRRRITERNRQNNDASDADLAVLDHQLETADAIGTDEEPDAVAVATNEAIDTDCLADAIREKAG